MKIHLNRASFLKQKFERVYEQNSFHGLISLSGPGSELDQTQVLEKALPETFRSLNIKQILDVPCGDQNWIKRINLDSFIYIGADIVPEIINKNNFEFSSENKSFLCLDITKEIPPISELVLCRDLLVHLDTKRIRKALHNLKASGATFLLTTTFSQNRVYQNLPFITRGVGWRPINFQKSPFNFPEPLLSINEGCTEGEGRFSDKTLALWKFSDLNINTF